MEQTWRPGLTRLSFNSHWRPAQLLMQVKGHWRPLLDILQPWAHHQLYVSMQPIPATEERSKDGGSSQFGISECGFSALRRSLPTLPPNCSGRLRRMMHCVRAIAVKSVVRCRSLALLTGAIVENVVLLGWPLNSCGALHKGPEPGLVEQGQLLRGG